MAGKKSKLKLVLPWVRKELMPNRKNGRHYSYSYAAKKKARKEGYETAKALGQVVDADSAALRITFHQPNRIRRDLDNLYASMKPTLDGISEALGCDDSQFRPVTIDKVVAKDKTNPMVVIEIEWQPTTEAESLIY